MAILHTHRNAIQYLSRARVFVHDGVVSYECADEKNVQQWPIPSANIAVLLLSEGCSVTTAAHRLLAEDKVLVGFTGGGGVPLFMGSMSEYRPTDRAQSWVTMWMDEKKRLDAAKSFARLRIKHFQEMVSHTTLPNLIGKNTDIIRAGNTFENGVKNSTNVNVLMGYEGAYAKKIYQIMAEAFKLEWKGRNNDHGDCVSKDVANSLLDHGNYLLYGCAAVALWCYGIQPAFPVTHGATRAGGLVFDLADTLKDSIVIPTAFQCVHEGLSDKKFRGILIKKIQDQGIIEKCMLAINAVIDEAK